MSSISVSDADIARADAQIERVAFLLMNNRLEEALSDIGQNIPGTRAQDSIRLSLKAAICFGLEDFTTASKINKALMFNKHAHDWAAFQEGLESLRHGRPDHAVVCFKLSFDYGLVPYLRYVEANRRHLAPLIKQIADRYPRLFPDKIRFSRLLDQMMQNEPRPWTLYPDSIGFLQAFCQAAFEWNTLGAHFAQDDYVFGPASGGLTRPVSDVIETLLQSHWRAWDAGKTPQPDYVARLTAAEKAESLARRVLLVMRSHDDRDGRMVESETTYHQRATLTEVGAEVGVCADPVFHNPDPAAAARLLRRDLDRFKPDTIIFMLDVIKNCNPAFTGALKTLKAEYGFTVLGMLNDPNEHHPSCLFFDRWRHVVDLFFTLPCDNTTVRDLKARGQLIDAMPIFETKFIETCTLEAKNLDLVYCGNAAPIRIHMLDALEPVFDNNFISMQGRTNAGPLSTEDYLAKLRAGRFAFNSNREMSIEVTRGRVFENVAAGVLLLDFDSPQARRCYAPFIHYVPVTNRDQLVQFARFFAENPHWRDKIAEAGRALWLGPLSPKQTWGAIFGALDRRCR